MFRSVRVRLVVLVAVVALVSSCLTVVIAPKLFTKQSVKDISVPETTSINSTDIFNLVNQKRTSAGLKPLTLNPLLVRSAADKCGDMAVRGYFEHNTPDGETPWQFMKNVGYNADSTWVGENLNETYLLDASSNVVDTWMNSPEHRSNILDSHYTTTGIAVCSNGSAQPDGYQLFIVQHFGGL